MQVKDRHLTIMIVLAVLALFLGIGIQAALAVDRSARENAQAQVIAVELGQAVETARQGWAERTVLDTQALSALPAQKRRAYEDLHLELLLLVNPWNPVPEGYQVWLQPVAEYQIGEEKQQMDVRCADALEQMLADCERAGNMPYVCSSYRTLGMQQVLYYNKLAKLLEWGWGYDEAQVQAAQSVAYPGTSEHQLGLAADIIDYNYTELDEGQEKTETQQWLMENSWRYGFILRYPNGTTDITGIIYEPWHYRYVGTHFAKAIYDKGITLEEYIMLRRGR